MALRTLAMWALMSVGATATLTSNEQTLILNRHNKLRSETARKASLPKGNADHLPCTASDMEKMTWDTTLATEAQTYADQCIGDHPAGAGSDFGENLWMLISSDAYASTDLESGVQEWYDEIVDTVWKIDDPKGPQSKPLKDCKDVSGSTCNVGHYYQTIWAASNRVGCGVKKCSSGMTVQGTPYSKGAIMVCRYQSPASLGAGITHTPPFIFGKACAACPDSCEDGLCTKAPIRCLDKTNFMIEIDKKYTDCASIVAAKPSGKDWCTELAPLMSAEGDCPKSCKTCTVPANIGTEFCGAASGTTSGGTTSGGTTKTTDTKTDTTTDTKTDTKTGTSGATTSTGTSNTTKVATTSKYTGTISIDATGVTKEQVETASKKTLAKKLAVEETAVTTTATESRRLLESPELRRLAGSWSINFVITGVPAAKVAAIDAVATSLAADTTALKTEMATQLTAAGASKVAVDSLKVKSFAATKAEEVKTPAGSCTVGFPKDYTTLLQLKNNDTRIDYHVEGAFDLWLLAPTGPRLSPGKTYSPAWSDCRNCLGDLCVRIGQNFDGSIAYERLTDIAEQDCRTMTRTVSAWYLFPLDVQQTMCEDAGCLFVDSGGAAKDNHCNEKESPDSIPHYTVKYRQQPFVFRQYMNGHHVISGTEQIGTDTIIFPKWDDCAPCPIGTDTCVNIGGPPNGRHYISVSAIKPSGSCEERVSDCYGPWKKIRAAAQPAAAQPAAAPPAAALPAAAPPSPYVALQVNAA